MDIGNCLQQGWDAFKRRPVPQVLATLLVMVMMAVISLVNTVIPFLGSLAVLILDGLFIGGLTILALKAVRNQEMDVPDLFTPFKDRPVDYLVVGLAMQSGVIACGIGVIVTMFLFVFAPILVAQGSDFKTALLRSKDLCLANPIDVLVLGIILALANLLAALPCGLGLLVTVPVSYSALVSAFNQLQASQPPQIAASSGQPPPAV